MSNKKAHLLLHICLWLVLLISSACLWYYQKQQSLQSTEYAVKELIELNLINGYLSVSSKNIVQKIHYLKESNTEGSAAISDIYDSLAKSTLLYSIADCGTALQNELHKLEQFATLDKDKQTKILEKYLAPASTLQSKSTDSLLAATQQKILAYLNFRKSIPEKKSPEIDSLTLIAQHFNQYLFKGKKSYELLLQYALLENRLLTDYVNLLQQHYKKCMALNVKTQLMVLYSSHFIPELGKPFKIRTYLANVNTEGLKTVVINGQAHKIENGMVKYKIPTDKIGIHKMTVKFSYELYGLQHGEMTYQSMIKN